MQIKENKTIVEGKVQHIVPSPDGWGVEADVEVESTRPSAGYEDFLGAEPGSTIRVFAPDPDVLVEGQTRRMSITVLGGPKGSRAVVQSSEAK
jgi:hypothetical protein